MIHVSDSSEIKEKEKRTVRFASDIENSDSNSNNNILNEIENKIKKIQHQHKKRIVPTYDINDIKNAIKYINPKNLKYTIRVNQ